MVLLSTRKIKVKGRKKAKAFQYNQKILKQGYFKCASYKKNLLDNSLLIKLSAHTPTLRGETTFSALKNLKECLPIIISLKYTLEVDLEQMEYETDSSLPFLKTNLMEFLAKVIEPRKKYSEISCPFKNDLSYFNLLLQTIS